MALVRVRTQYAPHPMARAVTPTCCCCCCCVGTAAATTIALPLVAHRLASAAVPPEAAAGSPDEDRSPEAGDRFEDPPHADGADNGSATPRTGGTTVRRRAVAVALTGLAVPCGIVLTYISAINDVGIASALIGIAVALGLAMTGYLLVPVRPPVVAIAAPLGVGILAAVLAFCEMVAWLAIYSVTNLPWAIAPVVLGIPVLSTYLLLRLSGMRGGLRSPKSARHGGGRGASGRRRPEHD